MHGFVKITETGQACKKVTVLMGGYWKMLFSVLELL